MPEGHHNSSSFADVTIRYTLLLRFVTGYEKWKSLLLISELVHRSKADSGLGLEAQRSSVEQFIQGKGGDLIAAFTEVESGRKSERAELGDAIDLCLTTGATLVIAKLDRLSRKAEFLAKLESSKLKFTSTDMPDANQFTRGIFASLAQYEAQLISERTKAGLAAAKARGTKLGNPRLHLVRNTDTTKATQAAIEKAEERNALIRKRIARYETEAGKGLSLRELARLLNDDGCTTARGKKFSSHAN